MWRHLTVTPKPHGLNRPYTLNLLGPRPMSAASNVRAESRAALLKRTPGTELRGADEGLHPSVHLGLQGLGSGAWGLPPALQAGRMFRRF